MQGLYPDALLYSPILPRYNAMPLFFFSLPKFLGLKMSQLGRWLGRHVFCTKIFQPSVPAPDLGEIGVYPFQTCIVVEGQADFRYDPLYIAAALPPFLFSPCVKTPTLWLTQLYLFGPFSFSQYHSQYLLSLGYSPIRSEGNWTAITIQLNLFQLNFVLSETSLLVLVFR